MQRIMKLSAKAAIMSAVLGVGILLTGMIPPARWMPAQQTVRNSTLRTQQTKQTEQDTAQRKVLREPDSIRISLPYRFLSAGCLDSLMMLFQAYIDDSLMIYDDILPASSYVITSIKYVGCSPPGCASSARIYATEHVYKACLASGREVLFEIKPVR